MQNSPLLGHSIAPPGEGPGGHRVKATETRPPRGSRPRAIRSAISLQARFKRPRKVTKSAGYPTTGPAIWPGRQYTNLPRIPQAELPSIRRAPQDTDTRIMLLRGIAKTAGLLQAELNRDGQVHGHGFAVERCGLVLPLPQSVHGRLMQKGRAGNDFHGGHAPIGINERVDSNIAGDMLVPRQGGINGRNRGNEFCLLHISANGKGHDGSRWLFKGHDGSRRLFVVIERPALSVSVLDSGCSSFRVSPRSASTAFCELWWRVTLGAARRTSPRVGFFTGSGVGTG